MDVSPFVVFIAFYGKLSFWFWMLLLFLKSAPTTPQDSIQTESRLRSLPAELRNRIYREALISQTPILLSKDSHQSPPLIRTCRQVRREATSIYYNENNFSVPCDNWDPTDVLAFNKRLFRLRETLGGTVYVEFFSLSHSGSGKHWPNLLRYFHAYHAGRTGTICRGSPDPRNQAAVDAFGIVTILQGTPWSEVEKVLEVYRKAVARANGAGWVWEC